MANNECYINSRCKECEYWDCIKNCCSDTDEFWEKCAKDCDYTDLENPCKYYDYYDEDDDENSYYLELYDKLKYF